VACGRTLRREEFLTLCGTRYPTEHNLYLSVGGVWQNSEERRILDSLRDQIPRTLSLKRLTKLKKQYTVLILSRYVIMAFRKSS
jgi:hypothetical protein